MSNASSITCTRCNVAFTPSESQTKVITNMQRNGQAFAMMACPICQHTFPINPTTLLAPRQNVDNALPCPACTDGLISLIHGNKKTYWGCGTCGNIWQTSADLTAKRP